MRKHYSLAHADKVLTLVRKRLGRDFGRDRVSIACWANGREQGYFIEIFPRFKYGKEEDRSSGVCFAQQRASDAVVVVAGPYSEFDQQTNMPSDALWDRAMKCFNEDEEAARHIADFILRTMDPVAAAVMNGG